MRIDTRLVRGEGTNHSSSGDVVAPVHVSVTYDRSTQAAPSYFYSRGENPTRDALERTLASLEDARFSTSYPSGQSAIDAVVTVLVGDRPLIACSDLYSATRELFEANLEASQITYEDLSDPEAAASLILKGDRPVVWIETPTNPTLSIVDIELISQLTSRVNGTVVVDNTVAGPILQRPLDVGADVTLYSTTKIVCGHLDSLGGAVVHNDADLNTRLIYRRTITGSVPSAFDSYLTLRGIRTLSLRSHHQSRSALTIATALAEVPGVRRVAYPYSASHPQHGLAVKQMIGGGPLISFESVVPTSRVLSRLRLFDEAVSIGGFRSLAQAPAQQSHRQLDSKLLRSLGISTNLIRLSIGLEDAEDLVADLRQALAASTTGRV